MKKILPAIIIAFLAAVSAFALSHSDWINALDDILTDAKIRYFAPDTNVSDDIVLVLLDESTMKELPYRSPVPRDFLFKLNEKFMAGEPKVIGYDIFFKDPTLAIDDRQLAISFKKGNVYSVSAGKIGGDGKWFEDMPMELFANSLKGVGVSDLPFSSSDSTVRFAQFEFDYGGKLAPSFVAELYHAWSGGNAEALIHDPKVNLSLYGFNFSPHQNTRIRYIRPDASFKTYPANLVAKGLIPSDWFKDKIVLVGAAYDDGTDAYITPYFSARYDYKRMPGVNIHANTLNSLLTKQFYYEVGDHLMLFSFIFTGLLAAFLFLFGPIWRGTAGLFILMTLVLVKSIVNFSWHGLNIPIVPIEAELLLCFGISLGWRSITEGKQKRFIKGVFAKYVPPAVVDKMIANPKLLTLGGEQREVTCLFTDIAGFTTISERLDPKTLVSFLNEYLDKLTRVIFKYGGTLDKYEGDAIIAFFGAPLSLDDHRRSALSAAIEMQKANNEISEKWKETCGVEITTRIGINSGQVVVGNMGSDLRFDYTAIGDAMNLASRLESANKFFNTRILASESTIGRSSSDDVVSRPIANVKVKGKTTAIKLYEVVGFKSDLSAEELKKIQSAPEPKNTIELTSK